MGGAIRSEWPSPLPGAQRAVTSGHPVTDAGEPPRPDTEVFEMTASIDNIIDVAATPAPGPFDTADEIAFGERRGVLFVASVRDKTQCRHPAKRCACRDPARFIDTPDHLALHEIGVRLQPALRVYTENTANTGPAGIQSKDHPREIPRTAVHIRENTKSAPIPEKPCLAATCIIETRVPHQRAVCKYPERPPRRFRYGLRINNHLARYRGNTTKYAGLAVFNVKGTSIHCGRCKDTQWRKLIQ
ncbi:MAG: hypothetical protein MAG794_00488 [Gammaproteobacteria bacterium]|nr:hypothetical protein [Gammaproteobacteria bacterium]